MPLIRRTPYEAEKLEFQPLWIEGVITSDYEVDTLPLIFTAEADYDMYYTTLAGKHPRIRREIHEVKKLGSQAREFRLQGRIAECLDALEASLEARREIFEDDDYQLVAAQQHFCMTCIHFATHALVRMDSTSSFSLFKKAKDAIQRLLPAFERPLFEILLYNNWANYWVRRNKINAATQACAACVTRWSKLVSQLPAQDLNHKMITALLSVRYGVSLLFSQAYSKAFEVLNKALHEVEALRVKDAPKEETGALPPGVNSATLTIREGAAGDSTSVLPLRALSICLTSPYSNYDTKWPLHLVLKTVSLYNAGCSCAMLSRHEAAQELMQRSSVVFKTALAACQNGNGWWWVQIQAGYSYSQKALLEGGRNTVDHINKPQLSLQKMLLKDTAKQRAAQRSRAAQKAAPVDADHQADVSPTSPGKDSGSVGEIHSPDSDESADETEPGWRTLLPCLQGGMPFKAACEVLSRSPGGSPLQRMKPLRTTAERLLGKSQRRQQKHRHGKSEAELDDLREVEDACFNTGVGFHPKYHLFKLEAPPPDEIRVEPKLVKKRRQSPAAKKVEKKTSKLPTHAATYLPRSGSPKHDVETERAKLPRDILNEALLEMHFPNEEPPEDPYHAAALIRLHEKERRLESLNTYVSSLQQALACARKQVDDLEAERLQLAAVVDAGPQPLPDPFSREGEEEEEGEEGEEANKESDPAYCDTVVPHAPPISAVPKPFGGMGKIIELATTPSKEEDSAPLGLKEKPRRDSSADFMQGLKGLYSVPTKKTSGSPYRRPPDSLVANLKSAGERQQRLRALLPHLDPHGETYRMVVKELTANQKVLTWRARQRRKKKVLEAAKKGNIALSLFEGHKGAVAEETRLRAARKAGQFLCAAATCYIHAVLNEDNKVHDAASVTEEGEDGDAGADDQDHEFNEVEVSQIEGPEDGDEEEGGGDEGGEGNKEGGEGVEEERGDGSGEEHPVGEGEGEAVDAGQAVVSPDPQVDEEHAEGNEGGEDTHSNAGKGGGTDQVLHQADIAEGEGNRGASQDDPQEPEPTSNAGAVPDATPASD